VQERKLMTEINFGNVAFFYEATEVLAPDASYNAKSPEQKQVQLALSKMGEYFRAHENNDTHRISIAGGADVKELSPSR
jgi:hypothetical protein